MVDGVPEISAAAKSRMAICPKCGVAVERYDLVRDYG
jgi:hypothetical protein